MSRWGVLGRATALAFSALSLAVMLAGAVVVQFDDQYEAAGVLERPLVGILAGMFGAVILSPVTAVVSLAIGVVVARRTGQPRRSV
jgi:uncharacterized membrane protein